MRGIVDPRASSQLYSPSWKKGECRRKKHEEIEEQVTQPKRVMGQEISQRISPINKSALTTKGKEKTESKEKEEGDSGERDE